MKTRFAFIAFLLCLTCSVQVVFAESRDDRIKAKIEEEQKRLDELAQQVDQLAPLAETKSRLMAMQKTNDIAGMRNLFNSAAAPAIEAISAKDWKKANLEANKLRLVFGGTAALAGELMFVEARIDHGRMDRMSARRTLETIVTQHTNTGVLADAVILLADIYQPLGLDREIVSLRQNFPQITAPQFLFAVANSYYAIDQYDQANGLFTQLQSDPAFGFRSKAMLITIKAVSQDPRIALEEFLALEQATDPSTEYRFFLYIQIAQIYQILKENDKAIQYFERYQADNRAVMTDEVKVAMILLYLDNKQNDKAIVLLNQIIEKPTSREYFATATYLLAKIYEGSDKLDKAEDLMAQAIAQAYQVLDILDTKDFLLKKHRETADRFVKSQSLDEKKTLMKEIRALNASIKSTSDALDVLALGMTGEQLNSLSSLENKFLVYDQQISDLRFLIDSLNTTPNKPVEDLIKSEIANLKDDTIIINAMKYVSNLPVITEDDYQLAFLISTEQYFLDSFLYTLDELHQVANKTGKSSILPQLEQIRAEVKNDQNLLWTIAMFRFGELDLNSPQQQILDGEVVASHGLIQSLTVISQNIGIRFNRALANREGKDLRKLTQNQEVVRSDYSQMLTGLQYDVENVSQDYNYAMLNILFKKSVAVSQNQ